jgi:hypothetical protein
MNVYLDESGDLGWAFDKPYRSGGSSRFLTVVALIVPKPLAYLPKRIIKHIYQKRKSPTSVEIKGKDLSREEKILFGKEAVRMLKAQPTIHIGAITVKKQNVQPHIQSDSNKLYNYMVNFLLLEKIKDSPAVDFIPDPRTIKVKSGNSLIDYLQTQLWFEHNSATIIRHRPTESHQNLNLQFADFVSNIVWRRYEDNDYTAFRPLAAHIELKHLFF